MKRTKIVVFHIHLVCERDLLVITRREKSNLLDHPCQGTCGVCAAREAKYTDLVACPDFKRRVRNGNGS